MTKEELNKKAVQKIEEVLHHDKISRIKELLQKYHFKSEILRPEEVYERMKESELFELAETIADFTRFAAELWDIVEDEE